MARNRPSVDGPMRAAQYLRMSSDNQRYSTENQQNAIAEYAQAHGYDVVATYIDAGKSGLSLKGRDALKQLLSDALAVNRPFDAILVLDVSRWGRFQNPDQAAHYEFLCRQAGVRVVYCGEPFGEDVAPITTIIKHLKRVMAGEYSRELSVKLARAHLQQAQLGFRQGGSLIYGFRRLLVDPERRPRQVLNRGESKALSSDKVVVIPGPPEELAVIRRIFRLYVRDDLSVPAIAERLARSGVTGYGANPLRKWTIRHILSNELCVGQLTYNLTSKRLQGPTLRNPAPAWTRFSVFEPIVPVRQFRRAQELLAQERNPRWDKESIISALQRLLEQKGHLSQTVINAAEEAPCSETVTNWFGSLEAAYAAAGYSPPPQPQFGNNGKYWSEKAVLSGLRKLYAARGRITNRLVSGSDDLPSPTHIRRHFGSLPEAVRQAGLPVLSHSERQLDVWRRRRAAGVDQYYLGVRWTDVELLRAMKRLHKRYGYISNTLLDRNHDTPTTYYYAKRFGSVTMARLLARIPAETLSQSTTAAWKRRRAGKLIERGPRYPFQHPGLRYRSDQILIGLKRLAERVGVISMHRIDDDPTLPSAATVIGHFGSMKEAYRLAGLAKLDGRRFGMPRASSAPSTPYGSDG
jgi:DNA invertase Pin-like site-specific DNA recombinase